jgi:putative Ca2+/H+ antiporter (TMEM165/GDT1 family)
VDVKLLKTLFSWQVFSLAFITLLIAEMGDKTQLAVFTLVTETKMPLAVFLGASLALMVVTLIGALFGGLITKIIPPYYLKIGAAFLFLGIGGFTLWEALK